MGGDSPDDLDDVTEGETPTGGAWCYSRDGV